MDSLIEIEEDTRVPIRPRGQPLLEAESIRLASPAIESVITLETARRCLGTVNLYNTAKVRADAPDGRDGLVYKFGPHKGAKIYTPSCPDDRGHRPQKLPCCVDVRSRMPNTRDDHTLLGQVLERQKLLVISAPPCTFILGVPEEGVVWESKKLTKAVSRKQPESIIRHVTRPEEQDTVQIITLETKM
jgi:hypothetical protein